MVFVTQLLLRRASCSVTSLTGLARVSVPRYRQCRCYGPHPPCMANGWQRWLSRSSVVKKLPPDHLKAIDDYSIDNKKPNDPIDEFQTGMTLVQKVKIMVKNYGWVFIPLHATSCTFFFALFYVLVKMGLDTASLFEYCRIPIKSLKIGQSDSQFMSDIVVTTAIFKMTGVFRYPLDITATFMVTRFLRTYGYFLPPPGSTIRSDIKDKVAEKRVDLKHKVSSRRKTLRNDFTDRKVRMLAKLRSHSARRASLRHVRESLQKRIRVYLRKRRLIIKNSKAKKA